MGKGIIPGKRILIVSRTLFPNNSPRSFRTTELVMEFCRQGHEVTLYIVKDDPAQELLSAKYGFSLKDLGPLAFKEVPGGQKIKVLNILFRAIRRFLLLLFEYPDIELMFRVKKALQIEKDYDLLISIAVPHPIHWGVAWARTSEHRIARRWIADCGDPFMGDRLDSFRKLFYFKYFEKWFGRKADFISVPNDDHIGYYYPEVRSKIRIIPQGFSVDDTKLFTGEVKNDVPTFAFAGRFLPGLRDPRPFLDYLSTLDRDFRFVVFSQNSEFLLPYKNKLGNRLDLRGFIPREVLLFELGKMDFLVHLEFHTSVGSDSPSKFADYTFVRRPVLPINFQEPDKTLIYEFMAGNYENKLKLPEPGHYLISNVARRFLELIG